jgi:YVTN family beta-propeller protein
VTPITVATNTPGTPIPVSTAPAGIAITPDGKTAYVANGGSATVTPITVATNTPGTPIPVGSNPKGIAITPDQAPRAHMSVTSAAAGSPSSFDASASTVAYGTIASYQWNFGDGTTLTTSTATTTHTYATAGTYTASVTETSSGGTSTAQVFTGQTVSNNGSVQAVATQAVAVTAASSPVVPATGAATPTQPWAPLGGGGLVLLGLGLVLVSPKDGSRSYGGRAGTGGTTSRAGRYVVHTATAPNNR